MDTNQHPRLPQNFVLVTTVIVLLVDVISLYLSYVVFSSEAWQKESSGVGGWVIELVRGIIILVAAIYLNTVVFRNEACKLLQLHEHPPEESTRLWRIRIIGLLIALVGVGLVLYHHLYSGPSELATKSTIPECLSYDHSAPLQPGQIGYFERYQRPFLFYFPYSFMQYIGLALPIFLVAVYAAIEDLFRIKSIRKTLTEKARTVGIIDDGCEDINQIFGFFCLKFIEIVGRYSTLVLFLVMFLSFEFWIGQHTLQSKNARIIVFGASFIVAAAISAILWGFLYYGSAFREAQRGLLELECDVEDFKATNASLKIVGIIFRRFRRDISLYIALIFFALTPFIAQLLTWGKSSTC